jgi:hypothetical protein
MSHGAHITLLWITAIITSATIWIAADHDRDKQAALQTLEKRVEKIERQTESKPSRAYGFFSPDVEKRGPNK